MNHLDRSLVDQIEPEKNPLVQLFPSSSTMLNLFLQRNKEHFSQAVKNFAKLRKTTIGSGFSCYNDKDKYNFSLRVFQLGNPALDSPRGTSAYLPSDYASFRCNYALEGEINGTPVDLETKLEIFQGYARDYPRYPQLTVMRYDLNTDYWFLADPARKVKNERNAENAKEFIYLANHRSIDGAEEIEKFLKSLKNNE